MLSVRGKVLLAVFGILPATLLAYDAGIIAVGDGFDLLRRAPTGSVFAFIWAATGLVGYVTLWYLLLEGRKLWIVRVGALAGMCAALPLAVMTAEWWFRIVCFAPIAVGAWVLTRSFRRSPNAA